MHRSEAELLRFGQQVKEKLEIKRTEYMYRDLTECKFRPSITRKSEKMLSDRGHSEGRQDKFSNLYDDARRRKERQDKIYSACVESECTFNPDTAQTRFYYQ